MIASAKCPLFSAMCGPQHPHHPRSKGISIRTRTGLNEAVRCIQAKGSGGWVVCGPKFAGKTTLVCAALEHLGADFVSNDRVYLGLTATGLRVLSWPMSVRIGVGTCLSSARLRPWLWGGRTLAYPQAGWDPARGLSVAEARRLAGLREHGPKVELVPSELIEALGARSIAGDSIVGVLLPRREGNRRFAEVCATDPIEATERVTEQLLTPDDDAYPDWLQQRRRSREDLRIAARALVERLVREVPVLEVVFSDGESAANALGKALGSNRLLSMGGRNSPGNRSDVS